MFYSSGDWGDLLTSYDGHAITYDGVGNPLTDGTWTYTWEHGRQLAQMSAEKLDGNKDISITYTYDADGMRTGKTVTTKNYTLLHTHSYTKTVVEPTCKMKGYTLYQCACGYSFKFGKVPALGHRPSPKNLSICIRCGCVLPSDDQIILPVEPKPPIETDSVGTEYAISALPGNQDLGNVESTELVLQSTVVETYFYVYTDSRLTQETVTTVTTTDEGTETTTDTLDYFYGVNGPTIVTWNGTTYYYAVNGQGDVMGIFDGSGNCVVTYNWDNAWGYNPEPEGSLASTLGTLNPLRYRGYVFDTETSYYYLQSRYYNPKVGRFINADVFISTGQGLLGNNMFTYCNNNPVLYSDHSGCILGFDDVAIVYGLCAFLAVVVIALAPPLPVYSTMEPIYYSKPDVNCTRPSEEDGLSQKLPNQGTVSEVPDAPDVDAGKQGKHVSGHPNSNPSKTQWNAGETGVKETQEAWLNGKSVKPDGSVKIGISSDGRVIKVHIDGKGNIHGYPLDYHFKMW